MSDKPLFDRPPLVDIEREAIDLYRQRYPDGTPWQELHLDTRLMWVCHANEKRKKS